MKRKLAFIFLFIVLGAIGYLGFSIYDELQQKQAVKKRIAELPKFSAVNLEGETIQSHKLTGRTPLILTYFNTGCDFCRAEITSMRKHQGLQEKTDIYLVSDESSKVLRKFVSEFQLDSLQTIQVLQDTSRKVKELFGVKGVPSTFIYDRDGKLLKNFQGETKAEVLYELVQ